MKHNDRLLVTHVYNKAKTDLTYNYKPEYIRDSYEATLFTRVFLFTKIPKKLPGGKYEFIWEPVKESLGTKGHIGELAKIHNADFLVIGFSGIKGPKQYFC